MEEKIKKARNFRNYKVWQDAVNYASKVYKVETQLLISMNIGYIDAELFDGLMKDLKEIERQINGLISSIRKG